MDRRRKKKLLVFAALLGLFVFLLAAFDVRLKTVVYQVETEKLTGQVRLALITDLHGCAYGDGQETLTRAIAAQDPDAVLLGGDLFDENMPYDGVLCLLDFLSERYPCYFVTGNHEYWGDDVNAILEQVSSRGITVLSGTSVILEANGQKINLCGIDDPDAGISAGDGGMHARQLEALRSVSENGYYTILLAHRPEEIESYLNYGFDLVLAGHAHGGQWRLPGLLNGLYAPNQGFFPPFAGGSYAFETGQMIVSRGLARESTRLPRIFNRPELVIIAVSPDSKEYN